MSGSASECICGWGGCCGGGRHSYGSKVGPIALPSCTGTSLFRFEFLFVLRTFAAVSAGVLNFLRPIVPVVVVYASRGTAGKAGGTHVVGKEGCAPPTSTIGKGGCTSSAFCSIVRRVEQ